MSTFDPQKLVTIAENQEKVYEAGEKNLENILTNNGARTSYGDFFRQCTFEDLPFIPKNIEASPGMFQECKNLKEVDGVDLSQIPAADNLFANTTSLERVLNTPTPNAKTITYMFFNSGVREINPLNISSVGTASYQSTSAFGNCKNLTTVVVEGVIPCSVNFKSSPLSKASIVSIIEHLSDTASGLTFTLPKTAKEAAFSEEEWASLIATKPNWTISLATA